MNKIVWAAMQSPEVLGAVDLMLPDLVSEEELWMLEVVRTTKQDALEQGYVQQAIANGGILTAVGLVILMIPDPAVYSVGFYLGGPIGGVVLVVVVNVVGIGLILLDQVI